MSVCASRSRLGAPIALFVAALLLALAATLLLSATLSRPAHAQDGGAGGYVIQPGDTLGEIAARFGVSLEALTAVNGITDPNLITAGRVLVIPGVTTSVAPASIATGAVYARPGDTLGSVARRYAQEADLIAALNGLTVTARLFPGRPVLLPAEAAPPAPLRFGSIVAIDASSPIEQGRTGRVTIRSSRPLTLSVHWNGLPIVPAPLDAVTTQVALVPAPALIETGFYPLSVAYATLGGVMVTRTLQIQVVDGGYESQVISVPSDRKDLLAPERVQAEEAKVRAALSAFTSDLALRVAFVRPLGPAHSTTSPFGTRRYYDSGPNSYNGYHAGQDFSAGVGITVTAPATGVVALAEPLDTRGNAVIVDHGRGVFSGYWHMSQLLVAPGQLVTPGQPIGLVGNTGLSTGAHLHWELRIFGVAVDPMQFLEEPLFPPRSP